MDPRAGAPLPPPPHGAHGGYSNGAPSRSPMAAPPPPPLQQPTGYAGPGAPSAPMGSHPHPRPHPQQQQQQQFARSPVATPRQPPQPPAGYPVSNGHGAPAPAAAAPRADQALAHQMSRVDLNQPPEPMHQQQQTQPAHHHQQPQKQPSLPPPAPPAAPVEGPTLAKAKRSARAYHKPEQAPRGSSGVPPQQQQPPYGDQQLPPHQQQDPRYDDHRGPPTGPLGPAYGNPNQPPYAGHPSSQHPPQHPAHPGPGAPAAYDQQQQHHNQQLHPQHQQNPQAPYQNVPPASGPDPSSGRSGYLTEQPGIPQPPHSAGQRIPGKMRVRIDPDHIPSPVDVQQIDQQMYQDEPYLTCSRTAAPLSTTEFVAIDQGNCNPRFMRMTTYNLPVTDDLATASQLPLGFVVQPFAMLREEEGGVPLIESGENRPARCQRCRGYINPWCLFIEGGQKFVCNLCGATSEVAPEYFSHLDMSQRRMDLDQRPELRMGSVDFLVDKAYWVQDNPSQPGKSAREPKPMHYIFAIDVSWTSMRCGLVGEVVKGLKEMLYPEEEGAVSCLPLGAKIAIMTFDRSVQFFNLKAGLDQAQMLVVSDITDMFVPLLEGFLVDPVESRSVIEGLLDTLPTLTAETTIVEAAMSGPVTAAVMALRNIGGQLNIFQTSLPTTGMGALKHREDTKLYGTDKEKTLFLPQDPWYRATAEECVEAGIGVNLFLFPTQYIDVASLSVLSGLSGGEVFFHPRFAPVRDGTKLRAEIKQVVRRETGYSVTMRIRCSNGLRVSDHFGNFFQRNVTDLEFGTMDSDKAIAARLKHEGKLDDKVDAHFQCAVLYTAANGQRRVRVHNLAVPVTSLLANVFRFADMDTTLTYVTKEAVTQTATKSLRQVRDQLTELCVKALLAYRKHCASSTSPAQLILPESFKLFPLYALALMKTKALKGGPVASDVRTYSMRAVKSLGVTATLRLLYPRFLAIHNLPDEVGFPDERGRLRLPPLIRTSYARMEPHGVYLIENGDFVILWIGAAVSPQILQDLYGADSLEELDTRMTSLPVLPTLLSTQVRNILALFERQAGGKVFSVLIARQNIDGTEIEFSNMLVEDSNNEQVSGTASLSYSESLCHIHSLIQSDLMGESKKSDFDVNSFSTW
ncbi:BQ2448_5192 [Microbotryum intermedium]|uniref:BQ2448_5192 protein n=1 Tax=Microbotryum intermedium TaxID=269621 RepID=A0A238F6B7_9BASI|nr:BQ2448_5192 [Microbotryum intermedium]